MISDYVKGKQQYEYPPMIQSGIRLHRAIDHYTDMHPINRSMRKVFAVPYRLYAGAILDVVYDHFLANSPACFPPGSLANFSSWTYSALEPFQEWFPPYFARIFPYMSSQDWLFQYREKQGIYNSLKGIQRRARYMPDSETAFVLFEEHYPALENAFNEFFPQLEAMTRKFREKDFTI